MHTAAEAHIQIHQKSLYIYMKNEAHTQQDMVAALHNCINIQHHTIDENGHALLDEKQQTCTTLVKPQK